jgi:hypothetical protein
MPGWIVKLALCLLPLAISPALFFLIAEGHLNFGGGEKDILLLVPWLIWSLIYAIVFGILWARGWPARRSVAYAASLATALILVAWLALFAYSAGWLGIS